MINIFQVIDNIVQTIDVIQFFQGFAVWSLYPEIIDEFVKLKKCVLSKALQENCESLVICIYLVFHSHLLFMPFTFTAVVLENNIFLLDMKVLVGQRLKDWYIYST